MKSSTSYKHIFKLSLPIMIGSAAQNIIVLSDNIFLFHYNSLDFAAIGLVGAFYLIIASIGFGFSRGGQILMARHYGNKSYTKVGSYFKSLCIFEMIMSIIIFAGIQLFARPLFELLVKSPEILERCLDYIYIRSYGVFFSFVGVSMIAFYSGIAKPSFIIVDTLILTITNIVLNYAMVFGHFGFEPMGIKGAAYASTISEVVAFIAFLIYMIVSKHNSKFELMNLKEINLSSVKQTFHTAFPILAQSFLGLGAYFLFFTWIENQGEEQLSISNLIRNVYLILSIPTWGYSTGINTIVSLFIGKLKRQAVVPITLKTTKLNVISSLIIAIPVLLLPTFFLYPLYGGGDNNLILKSVDLLRLLLPIIFIFGIGSIYINGIMGTGNTRIALWIQALATAIYLSYEYVVIKVYDLNLIWAWSGEFAYWGSILVFSVLYLNSKKWFDFKI